jgi:hypothetical protein
MVRVFVLSTLGFCLLTTCSCAGRQQLKTKNDPGDKVRLITLDPGHYHAALVQRSMYEQVDPIVRVYAPDGPDVDNHLKQIQRFNERSVSMPRTAPMWTIT